MKTDELRVALAAIERTLNNRVVIVHVVIGADGHVLRRITCPVPRLFPHLSPRPTTATQRHATEEDP